MELKIIKWVIMDKDRIVIAKGVPRSRYLVAVDDEKDKKRILYYDSENKARAGFSTGFFTETNKRWHEYDLEPVKVEIAIREIE